MEEQVGAEQLEELLECEQQQQAPPPPTSPTDDDGTGEEAMGVRDLSLIHI